jgi:hypothetical protein
MLQALEGKNPKGSMKFEQLGFFAFSQINILPVLFLVGIAELFTQKRIDMVVQNTELLLR